MTRGRRALEAPDAADVVCYLCGARALALQDGDGNWFANEVCGDCNRAFQELADAFRDAATRRDARQAVVADQVAGQLELDQLIEDLEAERANGYRARPAEARQVLDALRRGQTWSAAGDTDARTGWAAGIPTTALDAVLQDDRDAAGALLLPAERQAILAVMRNRA